MLNQIVRNFTRVKAINDVSFIAIDTSKNILNSLIDFKPSLKNISRGGLALQLEAPKDKSITKLIMPGSRLSLSVELFSKLPRLIVEGEVVWIKREHQNYFFGLKLLGNKAAQLTIDEFITKRSFDKASSDNLAVILKDLISNFIDVDDKKFNYDLKLDELGLDSFTILEILVSIELKFGIAIDESKIMGVKTFRDLLNIVSEHYIINV